MTKKPSIKNREWEKERRDRLNQAVDKLGQMGMPHFDPKSPPSKIDIMLRAIQVIEELRRHIGELLAGRGDVFIKSQLQLEQNISNVLQHNEKLQGLLKRARISIPPFEPILKNVLKPLQPTATMQASANIATTPKTVTALQPLNCISELKVQVHPGQPPIHLKLIGAAAPPAPAAPVTAAVAASTVKPASITTVGTQTTAIPPARIFRLHGLCGPLGGTSKIMVVSKELDADGNIKQVRSTQLDTAPLGAKVAIPALKRRNVRQKIRHTRKRRKLVKVPASLPKQVTKRAEPMLATPAAKKPASQSELTVAERNVPPPAITKRAAETTEENDAKRQKVVDSDICAESPATIMPLTNTCAADRPADFIRPPSMEVPFDPSYPQSSALARPVALSSQDIIDGLHEPQHSPRGESVSPTAAFLLSFPVVSVAARSDDVQMESSTASAPATVTQQHAEHAETPQQQPNILENISSLLSTKDYEHFVEDVSTTEQNMSRVNVKKAPDVGGASSVSKPATTAGLKPRRLDSHEAFLMPAPKTKKTSSVTITFCVTPTSHTSTNIGCSSSSNSSSQAVVTTTSKISAAHMPYLYSNVQAVTETVTSQNSAHMPIVYSNVQSQVTKTVTSQITSAHAPNLYSNALSLAASSVSSIATMSNAAVKSNYSLDTGSFTFSLTSTTATPSVTTTAPAADSANSQILPASTMSFHHAAAPPDRSIMSTIANAYNYGHKSSTKATSSVTMAPAAIVTANIQLLPASVSSHQTAAPPDSSIMTMTANTHNYGHQSSTTAISSVTTTPAAAANANNQLLPVSAIFHHTAVPDIMTANAAYNPIIFESVKSTGTQFTFSLTSGTQTSSLTSMAANPSSIDKSLLPYNFRQNADEPKLTNVGKTRSTPIQIHSVVTICNARTTEHSGTKPSFSVDNMTSTAAIPVQVYNTSYSYSGQVAPRTNVAERTISNELITTSHAKTIEHSNTKSSFSVDNMTSTAAPVQACNTTYPFTGQHVTPRPIAEHSISNVQMSIDSDKTTDHSSTKSSFREDNMTSTAVTERSISNEQIKTGHAKTTELSITKPSFSVDNMTSTAAPVQVYSTTYPYSGQVAPRTVAESTGHAKTIEHSSTKPSFTVDNMTSTKTPVQCTYLYSDQAAPQSVTEGTVSNEQINTGHANTTEHSGSKPSFSVDNMTSSAAPVQVYTTTYPYTGRAAPQPFAEHSISNVQMTTGQVNTSEHSSTKSSFKEDNMTSTAAPMQVYTTTYPYTGQAAPQPVTERSMSNDQINTDHAKTTEHSGSKSSFSVDNMTSSAAPVQVYNTNYPYTGQAAPQPIAEHSISNVQMTTSQVKTTEHSSTKSSFKEDNMTSTAAPDQMYTTTYSYTGQVAPQPVTERTISNVRMTTSHAKTTEQSGSKPSFSVDNMTSTAATGQMYTTTYPYTGQAAPQPIAEHSISNVQMTTSHAETKDHSSTKPSFSVDNMSSTVAPAQVYNTTYPYTGQVAPQPVTERTISHEQMTTGHSKTTEHSGTKPSFSVDNMTSKTAPVQVFTSTYSYTGQVASQSVTERSISNVPMTTGQAKIIDHSGTKPSFSVDNMTSTLAAPVNAYNTSYPYSDQVAPRTTGHAKPIEHSRTKPSFSVDNMTSTEAPVQVYNTTYPYTGQVASQPVTESSLSNVQMTSHAITIDHSKSTKSTFSVDNMTSTAAPVQGYNTTYPYTGQVAPQHVANRTISHNELASNNAPYAPLLTYDYSHTSGDSATDRTSAFQMNLPFSVCNAVTPQPTFASSTLNERGLTNRGSTIDQQLAGLPALSIPAPSYNHNAADKTSAEFANSAFTVCSGAGQHPSSPPSNKKLCSTLSQVSPLHSIPAPPVPHQKVSAAANKTHVNWMTSTSTIVSPGIASAYFNEFNPSIPPSHEYTPAYYPTPKPADLSAYGAVMSSQPPPPSSAVPNVPDDSLAWSPNKLLNASAATATLPTLHGDLALNTFGAAPASAPSSTVRPYSSAAAASTKTGFSVCNLVSKEKKIPSHVQQTSTQQTHSFQQYATPTLITTSTTTTTTTSKSSAFSTEALLASVSGAGSISSSHYSQQPSCQNYKQPPPPPTFNYNSMDMYTPSAIGGDSMSSYNYYPGSYLANPGGGSISSYVNAPGGESDFFSPPLGDGSGRESSLKSPAGYRSGYQQQQHQQQQQLPISHTYPFSGSVSAKSFGDQHYQPNQNQPQSKQQEQQQYSYNYKCVDDIATGSNNSAGIRALQHSSGQHSSMQRTDPPESGFGFKSHILPAISLPPLPPPPPPPLPPLALLPPPVIATTSSAPNSVQSTRMATETAPMSYGYHQSAAPTGYAYPQPLSMTMMSPPAVAADNSNYSHQLHHTPLPLNSSSFPWNPIQGASYSSNARAPSASSSSLPHYVRDSSNSNSTGLVSNFNLSTICPEINGGKKSTAETW